MDLRPVDGQGPGRRGLAPRHEGLRARPPRGGDREQHPRLPRGVLRDHARGRGRLVPLNERSGPRTSRGSSAWSRRPSASPATWATTSATPAGPRPPSRRSTSWTAPRAPRRRSCRRSTTRRSCSPAANTGAPGCATRTARSCTRPSDRVTSLRARSRASRSCPSSRRSPSTSCRRCSRAARSRSCGASASTPCPAPASARPASTRSPIVARPLGRGRPPAPLPAQGGSPSPQSRCRPRCSSAGGMPSRRSETFEFYGMTERCCRSHATPQC